jgi:hypothetical protein
MMNLIDLYLIYSFYISVIRWIDQVIFLYKIIEYKI